MTLLEILQKRRLDSAKVVAEEQETEIDVTKVRGYRPPSNIIIPRLSVCPELEQYEAIFEGCVDF